jgi:hypothetical protein
MKTPVKRLAPGWGPMVYYLKDIQPWLVGKTIKNIWYPQDNREYMPYEVQIDFTDDTSISFYADAEGGFTGTMGMMLYD